MFHVVQAGPGLEKFAHLLPGMIAGRLSSRCKSCRLYLRSSGPSDLQRMGAGRELGLQYTRFITDRKLLSVGDQ